MSRRSRDKGNRVELAIAKALQSRGLAAIKISGMYQPGPDLVLSLLGRTLHVEVKARADGFRELYSWLESRSRSRSCACRWQRKLHKTEKANDRH
jgi:Holliday junction resolvase